MKLHIEDKGKNFEMEAKAAYVVLIDPENSDADVVLMAMGRGATGDIVTGIAKTLDSFFQTLTKGNRDAQQVLWKLFKKAYKTAGITGETRIERSEVRQIEED